MLALERKNRIPVLLANRKMSIYRLAQKTGQTYKTIYKLVKAESIPATIEYGTVVNVAAALGVKIDDLEGTENNGH